MNPNRHITFERIEQLLLPKLVEHLRAGNAAAAIRLLHGIEDELNGVEEDDRS